MKKLKQKELAERLGISKSYLSMILSGQRIPNPELAERLSSLEVHNFEAKYPLARRRSTAELLPFLFWCRGPESNWGHADFQSAALPTELPRHREYCSC